MKQADIDKITAKILAVNTDPQKVHEFICACANAKSIAENKVRAESFKQSLQIGFANLMNLTNKR